MTDLPVSTQWTKDAAEGISGETLEHVYLVRNHAIGEKGTGFATNGLIVTNQHVVRDAEPSQLEVVSPDRSRVDLEAMHTNRVLDLALLIPGGEIEEGLPLASDPRLSLGEEVCTWGFPLGYSGPSPLLSVGNVAGFRQDRRQGAPRKQIIVNGAFNRGNSGGALLPMEGEEVVGVVVSTHAPLTEFQQSALEAMANTEYGLQYTAQGPDGEVQFSEGQLAANLIEHLWNLTQVMIGEAIHVQELQSFLEDRGFR